MNRRQFIRVTGVASGLGPAALDTTAGRRQLDTPATAWTRTFDRGGEEMATTVVESPGGGYLFAGQTTEGGVRDALVVRTDERGRERWQETFGGDAADWVSAATRANGGYLLAGQTASRGNGQLDAWLLQLEDDGTERWQRPYGDTLDDRASSVLVDGGDYVFGGGTKSTGSGGIDAWLLKVDAAGDELWNQVFGGSGDDWVFSHVVTDDGGYLLVGETTSAGAGGRDAWVVKTDGNGDPQWNRVYGGSEDDYARAVVRAHDGGYVFAGGSKSNSSGGTDGWVVSVDRRGRKQWERRVGGSSDDRLVSLVRHGEGYLAVGATASSGRGGQSTQVVKIDASGGVVWRDTYGTGGTDYANAVVGGDDPLVAGAVDSGSGSSARLVKLAGRTSGPQLRADFTVAPDPPETEIQALYQESGSETDGASVSAYEWDVDGDGTFEKRGEMVHHSFDQVGQVPVTLRLRTASGETTARTKTFDVNVARTSSLRDAAREIESGTAANIDHSATVDSATATLNDRVRADRIPLDTAEEATERLLLAEEFTESVLGGLGPTEYDRTSEEYNLAAHTIELVLDILVDLAMIALSFVGGKIGKYVADKLPLLSGTVDNIVTKLDDAAAKLADYIASLSSTASARLNDAADDIAEKALKKLGNKAGSKGATDLLGGFIQDQIEATKADIAASLRRPVEYTAEVDGTQTDDDPFNGLDDGLALVYSELDPDGLEREGLSGSMAGARDALGTGVDKVDEELRVAHAGLQAIQDTLAKFGLIENLQQAFAAIQEGDAVETVVEILWAIGSLVGDIVSVVFNLVGAGYGQKTMNDIANIHYQTLDGIADGTSPWQQ